MLAIWELSISQVPILSLAQALEAVGVVERRPETERSGNKVRQTCQTELALTCVVGFRHSIIYRNPNPVRARPVPANQPALAVEALQVGQEPGTERGGGQTAGIKIR